MRLFLTGAAAGTCAALGIFIMAMAAVTGSPVHSAWGGLAVIAAVSFVLWWTTERRFERQEQVVERALINLVASGDLDLAAGGEA